MDSLVKPKRELAKRRKSTKVMNKVIELLQKDFSSTDISDMKNNPELLKYVCNEVENLVKKKYKIDKKKLVLEIINRVVTNLNDNDRKSMSDNIEFLHANGDIKKVKWLKYLAHVGLYVLKKFAR